MKRNIIILIFVNLVFSSCALKNGNEYPLTDVQINQSQHYLTLPIGIKENMVEIYTEGFYQHFIYSDNSYVVILRGGNAELNEPKNDSLGMHSRSQTVDRVRMIYGNVKKERKAEFDKAFDLMKENGLKKK